jgi:DNA polymerase III delta prime subunit
MLKQTLIPTQLFVGAQDTLVEKTEELLQKTFCNKKTSDCYCSQCRKIKNNQHESIVWINPEKDYTVKDIEIIFEKINFALDEGQSFFFILQKANNLNLACANKLLKILEEPPTGYNFILHTNNLNSILPTIVSRCHITNFAGEQDLDLYHPIANFFYNNEFSKPAEFEKELKNLHLTPSESTEILNNMINYFSLKIIEHYKEPIKDNVQLKYNKKVLAYLKEKMRKPAQSGSANLFWKNLYLSFPCK